ncbi:MAG TPA: VCBS repeat-containing protein, partial [Pyrinomonadaceae bacterium]
MPHSAHSSCAATSTRQLVRALLVAAFTLWLAASVHAAGPTPRFKTAPSYPVNGTQPRHIAAGDFNGDGLPDLATINYNSNNASILLNQGGGRYSAPNVFAVGTLPSFIVARDFNNDARLDLAITNSGDDNVSIFLGNGNGTFNAATSFATGAAPAAIAAGDFNGDMQVDLAIANGGATFVSILLGTGSGSFTAAANVPVIGAEGGGMMDVAAGDLNNDGKLDLVVPEYSSSTRTVSILPGVGNGTFGAKKSVNNIGSPYWPADAAIADINSDGNQDIVTTIFTNNGSNANGSVLVIFGNGTLNTSGNTATYGLNGGDPIKLVVADFNADNRPDVATADYGVSTTAVSVLLNTGTMA